MNKRQFFSTIALIPALFFMAIYSANSSATPKNISADVEFKGRLKSVSQCVINSNKPIDVYFGDVVINGIDIYKETGGPSGRYHKQYMINLKCDPGIDTVNAYLDGESSDFTNVSTIATSVAGLAVQILINNQEVDIGSSVIPVPVNKPMAIDLTLIKQPGVALPAQRFSAQVTLGIEIP